MRFFKLSSLIAVWAMFAITHTPSLLAADSPVQVVSSSEKPLVPLLAQKSMLIPHSDQSAVMSLYSNANIVVQLMSAGSNIVGEVELTAEEAGEFHFYATSPSLFADLKLEASDDQKWYVLGLLKGVQFKTVSNQLIAFNRLKMKKARAAQSRLLEGTLESSALSGSVPWSVTLGHAENAGVSLIFSKINRSQENGRQYFILKKTVGGLSELNYKMGKRHLQVERQQALNKPDLVSILLEYTPDVTELAHYQDITKLRILKSDAEISLKIQTYPYTAELHPPHYREIQLDYHFKNKAFSVAEDRIFERQQDNDYVLRARQAIDLGPSIEFLADELADLINNKNKVLGERGISVPVELVDLASLFDPSYQDGLIQDGFLKHISTFLVPSNSSSHASQQADLLASSLDTVLFEGGFTPILQFLNNFSHAFETTMRVYDQAAQVEFNNERRELVKKMKGPNYSLVVLPENQDLLLPSQSSFSVPDINEVISDEALEISDSKIELIDGDQERASANQGGKKNLLRVKNDLQVTSQQNDPFALIRKIPSQYEVSSKNNRPVFEAFRIVP